MSVFIVHILGHYITLKSIAITSISLNSESPWPTFPTFQVLVATLIVCTLY